MKNIQVYLSRNLSEMENIATRLERRVKGWPEGRLNISFMRNKRRFYHICKGEDGHLKRIYLDKDHTELARALAQKGFEEEVLVNAKEQAKEIRRFLSKYDPEAVLRVYDELSPERKELVKAGTLNREEYARQWQSVSYAPGAFDYKDPEYYTMKNERVRSKTEQIIADRLNNLALPYRYEYPYRLKNGKVIYPDFTILNDYTGEVFLLEHFGKMDDPDYVNNNFMLKMRSYISSGMYPGENLLFTTESQRHPFSMAELNRQLQHYFPEHFR